VGSCEVRVCDGDAPVSAGAVGDLQIRGPGLFIGYLDRPDFTAESFMMCATVSRGSLWLTQTETRPAAMVAM